MIKFTEDCFMGIPQIDKEHKYLFELLNYAHDTITLEEDERVTFTKNILQKLDDYASRHFAHEEAYMEAIGDPELQNQQKEHMAFIGKIEGLMDITNMDIDTFQETLEFLAYWLYHHIIGCDRMIGKSIVSDVTNPFAFVQMYHTGISFVDGEHKKLFAIIQRIYNMISEKMFFDKYDEILEILNELKEYTEVHFGHEEEFMESISYPGLKEQKKAHLYFVEKIVEIDLYELEEMDQNQKEYLFDMIKFLGDWLFNHVYSMDKEIARYVAENNL